MEEDVNSDYVPEKTRKNNKETDSAESREGVEKPKRVEQEVPQDEEPGLEEGYNWIRFDLRSYQGEESEEKLNCVCEHGLDLG